MVAVSAIRRIEIVGTSSGLDETRTKLEAVARAQTTVAQTAEGMAVTTEQSARRQLSAASNYDRLRRSIDETFRTEQRYAQGQSVIERAFEQGHIQATEYARSLQLLADKHGVVSLAAARQTAGLQRAAEMQARINAMTGVTGGSDSAARGADIEAYGQALTRLQAKYDPVFAASERYKASLAEIDQAQRVGAISVEISTQARLKAINSYNSEISALERVGAARKAAAQAMVNSQTVTPDRGADIAAYGKQLDDLRAKYSPLYAAGRQYKETLVEINMAAKVGALTETERAAAVQQTKTAFVQQVTSLKGVSTATGEMARQSGLAGHELVNLGRQAQDVVTMFAMGADPMQIFSSQAAQIFDVFASSKGTLSGFFQQTTSWLGNFLTGGRLAFGGVALSIGTAALALNSYLEGQRKVQMSLVGAGRASGQTVGSINAIAASGASPTGLSVSEARAFAAELASTGKIGRDNLEPLVKIGHDIATVYGTDAAEAAKMLGKAYADPVRGAEELNDRLGFLDAAMQRQIQNLVAQNRVWEAQRVLQAGVESGLVGVREATGTTTKFWTALGNEASNAWEKIGAGLSRVTGIGLKLGLDDQLKVAKDQLASFQKDLETAQEYAKSLGPDAKSVDTGYDAAIAGVKKYTAEVERLTASLKLSEGAAEAAQDRQRSFAQEAAMRTALPDVGQLEALKNQIVTLQGAIEDTKREIASLVPDEATGARLKTLTAALEMFNKALDKSQAATRGFKSEFQRLSEGNAIALDAVTAFSPKAKADIAKRQAELTYSQDPNVAKLGQDAYNLSLKQSVVSLSEAARARELYAKLSEAAAIEELKMVGLSVGKQAEMRANLQARQALEQQLLQTHGQWGPAQDAELARLAEINKRYGEQAQLIAKAQINDQIKFDKATIGLPQDEVQIAQQLRTIYPDVTEALNSTEAAGMRLNNQLREARDISAGFANDLVSGLLRGDDVMKSLMSSASGLVQKLGAANLNRLMQGGSIFGNQSLNSAQGALGMVGAGVAGYQSGNALTGALGGAMAGATFGPAGAVAGGIIGLVGGIFGANEQSKKKLEAAQKVWKDSAPAFNAFLTAMSGGAQGDLSASIENARQQMLSLSYKADEARDYASLARIQSSFVRFELSQATKFQAMFNATLQGLADGLGMDSPFSRAVDAVKGQLQSVQKFIDDAITSNTTEYMSTYVDVDAARNTSMSYLLTLLKTPPALSEMQTSMLHIQGTAAGLQGALTQLGMSAEDAAYWIDKGVKAALNDLRKSFEDGLKSRLNSAAGNSYLNDAAALLDQHKKDLADATALGANASLVSAVFKAEAQKIVDDAGLIGDSFTDFIKLFPEFNGVVGESASALKAASDKIQTFVKSLNDYLNGLKVGPNSTLSPQAQLSAAQTNFNAQLALARHGNEDALGTITQYATALLDQAKSFYASSAGYTAIYDLVTGALQELPGALGVVDGSTKIVSAINQTAQQSQALLNAQTLLMTTSNSLEQSQVSLAASQVALAQTSTDQLALLRNALAPSSVAVGASPDFGSGAILSNQAIDALNKIVWNTHATARNLQLLASNSYQHGPLPGALSGVYAQGGLVTGPGTGTSDSIPVWVSNGEGIIKESVMTALGGRVAIDNINAGRLPVMPMPVRVGGRTNDNQPAGLDWQALARALKQVSDRSDETLAGKIDQLIYAVEAMPGKTASATRRVVDTQKPRAA